MDTTTSTDVVWMGVKKNELAWNQWILGPKKIHLQAESNGSRAGERRRRLKPLHYVAFLAFLVHYKVLLVSAGLDI